jgi:hypothetical protein
MTSSNPESNPTPCTTVLPLEAAQLKSAKIEDITGTLLCVTHLLGGWVTCRNVMLLHEQASQ